MPIYDFGSVDEETCDRYNWGYDPVNYNVPEGSYSTNPFDGSVRIREVKQMVQALHNAGIKVIMDVVYNHMFSPVIGLERSVRTISCAVSPTARWPTDPAAAAIWPPNARCSAGSSWNP